MRLVTLSCRMKHVSLWVGRRLLSGPAEPIVPHTRKLARSTVRNAVLACLRRHGGVMTLKEIAEKTRKGENTIVTALNQLYESKQVAFEGNGFRIKNPQR